MKDAEFAATQQQLLMCAGLATQIDLVGYLERIETALEKGRALNPGVWDKAKPRLIELQDLAKALIGFQTLAIASMKREMEDAKKPHIIIPGINDAHVHFEVLPPVFSILTTPDSAFELVKAAIAGAATRRMPCRCSM